MKGKKLRKFGKKTVCSILVICVLLQIVLPSISNLNAIEILDLQDKDYIEINCIEDLVDLSKSGNKLDGKNVVLMKDLDFKEDSSYKDPLRTDYGDLNNDKRVQTLKEELTSGEGFTPISYFSGNFYGQGNEIRNIYIDSSIDYVGIFGIASNAKIRDLGVTGSIKTSKKYGCAGGIAGTINNNTSIINCYNIAELEGDYVGGIAGRVGDSCEISYCHNASNSLGDCKESIGGIVGESRGSNVTISNCYNTGSFEISGEDERVKSVGGILGEIYYYGVKIEKCYNSGNIHYTGDNTYIGGIAGGSALVTVDILECYNTGNIVASGDAEVGGIIGKSTSPYILNCYNKGKIEVEHSGENTTCIGGLVGYSYSDSKQGKIINSYNQGNILVNISNTGSAFITGICQSINVQDNSLLTGIGNCYNIGSIVCVGESGHCAEIDVKLEQEQVNSIKKCYYLDSSSNSAFGHDDVFSEEAIKMSEEEMKASSFVTILNDNRDYVYNELLEGEYNLLDWEQGEDGYPTLRIELDTTTPIYIKKINNKVDEQEDSQNQVIVDGIIYQLGSDGFGRECMHIIGVNESAKNKEVITIPAEVELEGKGKLWVEIIDDNAFEKTNLKKIYLPDTISRIEHKAFVNCMNLESVYIACSSNTDIDLPAGPVGISYDAFEGIENNITIYANPKELNSEIAKFAQSLNIKYVGGVLNEGIYYILDEEANISTAEKLYTNAINTYNHFEEEHIMPGDEENKWYNNEYNYNLEIKDKIVIRNQIFEVTKIGNESFMEGNFRHVILPEKITEVGEKAFANCNEMRTINIPMATIKIADNAFQGIEKNITIKGYNGSYAQEYAREHNIRFQDIGIEGKYFVFENDTYNFTNSKSNFDEKYLGVYSEFWKYFKDNAREYLEDMQEEKWSGSCLGMTETVAILKNGYLTRDKWEETGTKVNKTHDLTNSYKLRSLINLYQVLQGRLIVMDYQFETQGEVSNGVEGIYNNIKAYYSKNEGMLICDYLWKNLLGKRYGHEILITGAPEDVEGYVCKIPVYDSNYDEEIYMYIMNDFKGIEFKKGDGLFDSIQSLYIDGGIINSEITHIHVCKISGYYDIEGTIEKLDQMEQMYYLGQIDEEELRNNYIPIDLNLDESDRKEMIYKSTIPVKIQNNKNQHATIEEGEIAEGDLECEIKPIIGITADAVENEENGEGPITQDRVIFEDGDIYSIETVNKNDKLEASMLYRNSYMTATSNAGGKATFEKDKSVTLTDTNGQEYEIKLTLNDGYTSLPWNTIIANGENTTTIKLENTQDGILLTGDNLEGITVKGKEKTETVELKVSTDKNKVLIKSNDDKTKLVAFIDNDNNGSYETELSTQQEKTEKEDKQTSSSTDETDARTSNRILPQTGFASMFIIVCISIAGVCISYMKMKKVY